MSCAFYAYPDSSADIIWLVDYYNQRPKRPGRSNQFSVLYDSRLHLQQRQRAPEKQSTHKLDELAWYETPLYGARILVHESRSGDPAKCGDGEGANSSSSSSSSSDSSDLDTNNIGQPLDLLPVHGILKETKLVIQAAHVDDSAR